MNERKLRIFQEVATHLNMSAVAGKMYMSQPAVSQVVHELEQELGTRLFDRIGKKLYLTEAGRLFLHYVRKTLNTYAEGLKAISELNGLETGSLSIGASTTIGIYVLPDLIGRFHGRHPGVEFSITIEKTKVIAERVLDNAVDFAYVEGPVESKEIAVAEFCGDELVFITSPRHPWAAAGQVDIPDVNRGKFILREAGSGTREVFEQAMRQAGADYHVAFELGNTEAIKKAVEADLGVSCISLRAVTREVELGKLAVVRLNQRHIKRSLNLIYHRDKYMSALFKAFTQFAREQVRQPVDEIHRTLNSEPEA